MSIQSIILLVVIGLVLFIDNLFSDKEKEVTENLIEGNTNKKPKKNFSFNKNLFVYWFPLIFVFVGFFINDDLNSIIYEQTGFIYGSLVSWIIIFYYVTFFSYKSLITSKKRDKIIATEILYFFTIILLTLVIHFSSQYKQNSEDRFVISTSSYTKDYNCAPSPPEGTDWEDLLDYIPLEGEIFCDKEISTSFRARAFGTASGYSNISSIETTKINGGLYKYEYWDGETLFSSLSELQQDAATRGLNYDSNQISKMRIKTKKTSVSATITFEYLYDYLSPLMHIEWNKTVEKNGLMIKFDNKPLETGTREIPTYFIPFLINLLIIGYLWRAIFSLVFWSLRTLTKT